MGFWNHSCTRARLNIAVLISLIATVLNGFLSWMLNSKAKETQSLALEGDAKHLYSDVISSIGVAAGLIIGDRLNIGIIDPVIALIVASFVLRMGFKLVLKASGDLMDERARRVNNPG